MIKKLLLTNSTDDTKLCCIFCSEKHEGVQCKIIRKADVKKGGGRREETQLLRFSSAFNQILLNQKARVSTTVIYFIVVSYYEKT